MQSLGEGGASPGERATGRETGCVGHTEAHQPGLRNAHGQLNRLERRETTDEGVNHTSLGICPTKSLNINTRGGVVTRRSSLATRRAGALHHSRVQSLNAVKLTGPLIGAAGELRASRSIRVNQGAGSMEASCGEGGVRAGGPRRVRKWSEVALRSPQPLVSSCPAWHLHSSLRK